MSLKRYEENPRIVMFCVNKGELRVIHTLGSETLYLSALLCNYSSEQCFPCVYPADGSNMFLRNLGTHLPEYTEDHNINFFDYFVIIRTFSYWPLLWSNIHRIPTVQFTASQSTCISVKLRLDERQLLIRFICRL